MITAITTLLLSIARSVNQMTGFSEAITAGALCVSFLMDILLLIGLVRFVF